jgi:hypothetical protein
MSVADLSQEELDRLTACRSHLEWQRACGAVKKVRGGVYPGDWYARVLKSGLADRVLAGFGQDTHIRIEIMGKDGSVTFEELGGPEIDPTPLDPPKEQKAPTPVIKKAPTTEDPNDPHASFVTIYKPMGGWNSVIVCWSPEPGLGPQNGFWEPWDTGEGPFETEEEAIEDAKRWALEQGLHYRERGWVS